MSRQLRALPLLKSFRPLTHPAPGVSRCLPRHSLTSNAFSSVHILWNRWTSNQVWYQSRYSNQENSGGLTTGASQKQRWLNSSFRWIKPSLLYEGRNELIRVTKTGKLFGGRLYSDRVRTQVAVNSKAEIGWLKLVFWPTWWPPVLTLRESVGPEALLAAIDLAPGMTHHSAKKNK